MSSNPCNSSALTSLLGSLTGSNANALAQAGSVASMAREARSVAVSSNAGRPGFAASSSGEFIQGLRNRLFLKYAGIDYEFYNVYDLRYRT
jgi:hypothetical protein